MSPGGRPEEGQPGKFPGREFLAKWLPVSLPWGILAVGLVVTGGLHTAEVGATPETRLSVSILYTGTLGSIVLFILVWLLVHGRQRAIRMARLMTLELQESQFRWKVAIDGPGDGLMDWDLSTGTIYFSRRWKEMLGYTETEIGNGFDEWEKRIHPEDREETLAAVQAHLDGGTPIFRNEHRLLCRDGTWKWVLARGMIVNSDPIGKPLRVIGTHADITERKLVELSLQRELEKNKRFSDIMDDINAYVYIKDSRRRYQYANRLTLELFQCSAEELVGLGDERFFAPGDALERLATIDRRVLEQGETTSEEVVVAPIGAGGKERVYLEAKRPLYDAQGTIWGLSGVSTDITEQKRIESVLRENEQQLWEISSTLAEGLYVTDLEGRITFINPTALQLLGWGEDEVIGKESHALFHHSYPDGSPYPFSACVLKTMMQQPGVSTQTEEWFWHRDGSCFPVSIVLSNIVRNGAVRGTVVAFRDIGRRKQTEEALRKSTSFLETLFDTAHLAICFLDRDFNFIRVNKSYAAAAAQDPDFFPGRNHFDLFPHPENEAIFRQVVKSGEFHAVTAKPFEFRDHPEWGVTYWDWTLYPIKDQWGEVEWLIFVLHDVTKAKNTELSLVQAKRLAEAATRAKSGFLATMSHEIRTPLNAVIGMTNLCLRTGLTGQQRDYLNKINVSANFLLSIINDVLDFSKIEAGRLELERVEFSFEALLGNVASIIMFEADKNGIEFIIDRAEEVPSSLVGDPGRLSQVITNLVGNAVKFTQQGEVVLRIEVVRVGDQQCFLRFVVQDTGIGIAPEQLPNLFQDFSQGDSSTTRKYGGTGLGLVISKRLVEMMGGEIGVDSRPGEGSRFTFTASFGATDSALPLVPVLPQPLQGLSVLVADDNATAREVQCRLLEALGCRPVGVGGGREALAELAAGDLAGSPFGLVLIDWKMSPMDGLETIGQIQSSASAEKRPRVILMAGCDPQEVKTGGQDPGLADGFLMKPVMASPLFDAIMALFGLTEPNRSRHQEYDHTMDRLEYSHILLAEDNEINQQVARELLEQMGLHVTIANNGVEVLGLLREGVFDCVLMDVQMPVMDGLEAARRIRLEKGPEELPIIAMTANAMVEDRERCLEAGMNGHIAKPVVVKELYTVLSRWISRNPESAPSPPAASAPAVGVDPLPGLPPLPGIEVATGLRHLGGNMGLYQKVLVKFAANLEETSRRLRRHWEEGELGALEAVAHALKGVSATVGARRLATLAEDLERRAKSREHTGESSEALATLDRELARVEATIRAAFPDLDRSPDQPDSGEGDVGPELLEPLFRKAVAYLRGSDCAVEKVVDEIAPLAQGNRRRQRLQSIRKALGAYDFDAGLAHFRDWSVEEGIRLDR
ncbi:MAG: PAS domain S-box protein [Magnetococcales bacterium]|nr:PAS domain S-box protein [Magnetococcales bacterium]